MKKNKIWLLLTIGLLMLCFNDKVIAADTVIGFIECKYKLTTGKDKMDNYYVKDGVMTFYYSGVAFKDNDLSDEIFVKNKNYPDDFSSATGLGSAACKGSCFSSGYATKDTGNLIWSFKDSYEKNNASCPKYMVLKKVDGDKYTPYFANHDTYYCGSNLANCPVIGTNQPGGEKILVSGKERTWQTTWRGEGACDNVKLSFYFSGNKIKGDISYPASSSFYEKSAKKTVTLDVRTIPTQQGSTQIKYVYNLLKNNKISGKMFIRGDKGNEKIHLGEGGVASTTCTSDDGTTTAKYSNCTTFLTVQNQLTGRRNDGPQIMFDNLKLEFDAFANENLKKTGDKYTPIDYSTFNDVNTLNSLAEQIDNWTNKEKKGGKILSAYEEYNKIMTDNYDKLCSDEKEKIDNLKEKLAKDNEDIQAKATALGEALSKIKERLTALGANSDAVDTYLDNNSEFLEEVKHFYSVTKVTSLLGGTVTLQNRQGCNVITPELKDWLIQLLDMVKIAALVLTLILGMFDFFKGVASGEADAMKKMWKSFSRRLIAVVLLFLLPVIIEFILNLVTIYGVDASNPLCGIK